MIEIALSRELSAKKRTGRRDGRDCGENPGPFRISRFGLGLFYGHSRSHEYSAAHIIRREVFASAFLVESRRFAFPFAQRILGIDVA